MTTIATLAVKLIADAAGFISTMDAAEQKTQTWSQSVSKNLKTVGGNISDLGSKASMYLTLPLIAGGVAAVNYASDLEETKSKASVIFGEMTDDLMAWSSTAATAFGQSQRQALDGASNFAIFGSAAGLADEDLLKFAKTNTELASDLASFFNTSPEEAITAIGAAYRGESEPIRKYGVLLNEAALQQQALEMGLISQLGPLTQQQRILAAYELIMKQTAVAQGDFARTAEGVANSTRIARAQFEDAAAALGVQLLPYALQLIQWISRAITWFEALTPEQQKWVLGFLAIVAVIGPLLVVIGTLVTAVGAIIGVIGAITTPILIAIAVIAALIAIAYLLYQAWTQNWGGIQEKTQEVMDAVMGIIDIAMKVIRPLMAAGTAAMQGDWYAFGQNIGRAWRAAWDLVISLFKSAWTTLRNNVASMISNIIDFWMNTDWSQLGWAIAEGIANGLTSALDWLVEMALDIASNILEAATGLISGAGGGATQDAMGFAKRRDYGGDFGGTKILRQSAAGAGGGGLVLNNYGTIVTKDVSTISAKDIQKSQRLT